jgi:hypothetical protein
VFHGLGRAAAKGGDAGVMEVDEAFGYGELGAPNVPEGARGRRIGRRFASVRYLETHSCQYTLYTQGIVA